MGDQPENKKDLMLERFEHLLNRYGIKENNTAFVHEKILTLLTEVKSAKTTQKKVPRDYRLH